MSDVDEVKSRINIVDLIGKNVKLKKTGRNFKGLCPFHNEKTPSFVVSPDRQIFHCFGCGKGGTIFDYIMEYQRVDFAEALTDLADTAGVKLSHSMSATPEMKLKESLYAINHLASEFYQYILTKHALGERGLTYFRGRGITDKSIATFGLGYSPNSWDNLYNFLHKKGYEDELLEKAGLVLRSTKTRTNESSRFYDRFRGRVMFTLKDHRGNVVGFAGRVLDPKADEAKYINTSETPVYVKSNILYGLDVTKNAIQKTNDAVVMEGELDVISSFQQGISNVVAIKGSALTEGHVRLIRRYTEQLTFALDSDMAGDAAARRGIEIADKAGLTMRVVEIPSGKDPDDAVRENPVAFKKAIHDAVSVYDYFVTSAMKRYDGKTAYGKKKITDELLPVFAKIDNTIVQNHYIKLLSKQLNTPEELLQSNLTKHARGIPQEAVSTEKMQDVSFITRPEKLEVYLLALLLQGKTIDLFEDLQDNGLLPEFLHQTVHKIIDHMVSYISTVQNDPAQARIFLIKDFADQLPKELTSTLDEAFLWDLSDIVNDEDAFMREWISALKAFNIVITRRKLHALTQTLENDALLPAEKEVLKRQWQELVVRLRELEK